MSLPQAVATGTKVTLTFTYAGLLANEDNSPIPGVRTAVISKDGAYLLLPARWFPLTNYPANRYTATFRLNVPDSFAVAGTGKASAPHAAAGKNGVEGGRLLYTFQCDTPAPYGTFVAGELQLSPEQAEGINVAVYAPRSALGKPADFAADVARAVTMFSDMFGPLHNPDLSIAQLPDGTLRDFAAPGLLLVSQAPSGIPKAPIAPSRTWSPSQWWGNAVLPATPGDVWISDGLARYCEALYAEQKPAAKPASKPSTISPSARSWAKTPLRSRRPRASLPTPATIAPSSKNKGAMIFHMLRAQMGDVAFKVAPPRFLLQVRRQERHHRRIRESRAAKSRRRRQAGRCPRRSSADSSPSGSTPPACPTSRSTTSSTAPSKASASSARSSSRSTPSACPSTIRIDTEGNPETKTVDVVGTESPFTVETFGRPKPGGIKIDPEQRRP